MEQRFTEDGKSRLASDVKREANLLKFMIKKTKTLT